MKSNTQVRMPNNLYLGDVDGDGSAEFLQVAGNRLLVFRSNYEATGVLHHYFPTNILHIITGDFTTGGREHGREQICVILDDGSFQAYAISDDGQSLWWWFTQPNFIAAGEHAIVGDFDGDGADDILVYKRSTGTLHMYSRTARGNFSRMPGFSWGKERDPNLVNKRILSGNFGQTVGRDDLLVLDTVQGQVSRFDSATDSSGLKTFWWAFTTNPGVFSADDQVSVANIDGGPLDGIVARNTRTGNYHLYKAEYSNGSLTPVTNVLTGQLTVTAESGSVCFTRVKSANLLSEPGKLRDDALFFNSKTGQLIRTDARYDGSHFTYWWAYTRGTPTLNKGWRAMQHDKWAILLCKFKDRQDEPQNKDFFERLFTGAGVGGVVDYFRDISYGKLELSSSEVRGWYALPYNLADIPKSTLVPYHDARGDVFNDGLRVSGLTPITTTSGVHYKDGATGVIYKDAVVILNMPGTQYGGGNGVAVLAPPDLDVSSVPHEILHEYGLNVHSYDDTQNDSGGAPGEYGDRWDIMSAANVWSFTGFNMEPSGPEMNAPYKLRMLFLSSSRVLTLTPNSAGRQTTVVSIAALNRPEANGALMVKIPINNNGVSDHYFAVEFRQKSGWDTGIPQDAVLIHEVKTHILIDANTGRVTPLPGVSHLQTTQGGPQFLAGMTFTHTQFTITVNEIHSNDHKNDPSASTAGVTITC
jgi:hypothetical protein